LNIDCDEELLGAPDGDGERAVQEGNHSFAQLEETCEDDRSRVGILFEPEAIAELSCIEESAREHA
jgi:hypothetical protein